MSYIGQRDRNPHVGEVIFYGELMGIIEICYTNNIIFVMLKCNWIDNNEGMKWDKFKFTTVNFNHLLYRENRAVDEPFILASQA